MANIRPFRGLRYGASRADRAERVLAPPYDVVDETGRAVLAARSPDNCIHVILPEGIGQQKYANGAAAFRRLVSEAFVRDAEPGVYVYHQRFACEGKTYVRKGFVCLIELTRFGHGPVLAHERTLSGPKQDRLELMRACQAHVELVFGMFSDPERRWEQAVEGRLSAPVLDCEFDDVNHALWRVHDSDALDRLTHVLEDRSIYIADGHHRYETMCSYRDELEREGRGDRARYGMIYLSNLDDPGLVVLPTHRLLHSLPEIDVDRVSTSAREWFDVTKVPLPSDAGTLKTILAEAGSTRPAVGLAVPNRNILHLLALRSEFDAHATGLARLAAPLQQLDVVLLHELVLERLLGIGKPAQAAKTNLGYDKSTESALTIAHRGDGHTQLVCFMNATRVEDVRAVCDSGEVMPQKSTFFYPKIPTGLVFHDLRGDS